MPDQPAEPDHLVDDEFADVAELASRLGVDHPLRPSRLIAAAPHRNSRVSAIRWSSGAGRNGDPATAATAPDASAVFLHGVGIEAHSFDATALALGTPSLAVDLPGHGRSAWRDDADYSADAVAPDVLAALEALAVPPGILIGHSLGAIIAARMAAIAPTRVTGLVLVDMSPDFTQRAVDRIVRSLESEPDFADVDEVVARSRALGLGGDHAALVRDAVHSTVVGPAGRRIRRHHFPHLADGVAADVGRFVDAWADLDALDVPVLLVRGDRGYVSPRLVRSFGDRMPQAEAVTVQARHVVQTQAPLALADAIRRWRRAHDV